MPVDGIGRVEERDAEPCRERDALEPIDHARPGQGVVWLGRRAAAAQDGAEVEPGDVLHVSKVAPVDLHHLPELLLERHPSQQRVRSGQRRRSCDSSRRADADQTDHRGRDS